jgi:integrase
LSCSVLDKWVTGKKAIFCYPRRGRVTMLTDLQIKKLALPEGRKEVPDGKVSGLYLVVQPSGSKSWAIRYRVAGQPKKLTLGPYPAIDLATARRRAQEAIGDVAGGKDPAGEKKAVRAAARAERAAEDNRLDRIAASYVDRHVRRSVGKTWGKEIERLLRVEVLPKLGDKHIGAIRKQHILGLLDDIVDRGSPVAANRTFAVLRQLFNWAIDRDLIETSPMPKGAPSAETQRDRVLSDAEIRMVWRAFDSVGWPIGPIAKLLLLTGARRDEIAEGRWSEIDIESKSWTIAKERSKNGVAHEIPLSDAAITVLKGVPRIAGKPGFIFTTRGSASVGGFSTAKLAIDSATGESLPHWTFHDLRRTAASGMAGIGIAPHVVEAVLNHKSGTIKGVAAVYNRYSYATEKRQALDAWARRLDAILSSAGAGEDSGKVVRMDERQA